MKENIKKLGELISKSKKILLINHINMDVDAIGSLGTFYYILQKINKDVKAVNDSLPIEKFSFLGANNIIEPDLNIEKYNPDLIISFDAGDELRLGETYKKYEKVFLEKTFIVIDHHETNKGFGDINIIDSNISSTCEIIFLILKQLGLDKYITKKEATLLIAGIYADTNIFYNPDTTPSALKISAELMELGADFRTPAYVFFKQMNYNEVKLLSTIYNNLKRKKDGKILYFRINYEDIIKENLKKEDVNFRKIIYEISNIEGCEVVFYLYKTEENKVRASFRSKEFDVGNLCAKYSNGGGHKTSAGFLSDKNINEVEKEILEKLKDLN